MKKAFVTGGSGFIGQHLIPKLVSHGYQVSALARSEASAARVEAVGASAVRGDIRERDSMIDGMRGSDVVFHLAAWCDIGGDDWMQAEAINVNGTRNVLGLAVELEVPRIIYTSTVNVYGDTKGEIVDETYDPPNGPFLTECDRTKWMAHYQVALPMMREGAPIIILIPGAVYGPNDTSLLGTLMRRFYREQLRVVPGPETTVTWAHVDDVAEGHVLAAEKGEIGESYILAGPAIPLGEMIDFWSYITGRSAPALKIPSRLIKPLGGVVGSLEQALPLPEVVNQETIAILDTTFAARSDKARNELGWKPRSPQAGMVETFDWIAQQEGPAPPSSGQKEVAFVALGVALALFLLWLLGRQKE